MLPLRPQICTAPRNISETVTPSRQKPEGPSDRIRPTFVKDASYLEHLLKQLNAFNTACIQSFQGTRQEKLLLWPHSVEQSTPLRAADCAGFGGFLMPFRTTDLTAFRESGL